MRQSRNENVIRPTLLALALVLLIAASCPLAGQQAETAPEWFGFTPYPGTRELCSQSVRGQAGEEIVWHMHAAKDKPAQVADFYIKANDGSKVRHAEVERKGDAVTLRRGDIVLTIQPAGSDHPQCGGKPEAAEITVIIISRMSRPGKA
jgi:hypothetical protein